MASLIRRFTLSIQAIPVTKILLIINIDLLPLSMTKYHTKLERYKRITLSVRFTLFPTAPLYIIRAVCSLYK